MTFDDGILTIYSIKNGAEKGAKPIYLLAEKSKHYYGYDNIGLNRYYLALQADQEVSAVVNIPQWQDISAKEICALDDGKQYRILMVQPTLDEDNLRITKLTLERMGENYAVQSGTDKKSAADSNR